MHIMVETRRTKMSTDGHLNIYFQNKRIREYLIKAGLINRHGDILPVASNTNTSSNRSARRKSRRSPGKRAKSLVTIENTKKETIERTEEESRETKTVSIESESYTAIRARQVRLIPLYQPEKSRSVDLRNGKPLPKLRLDSAYQPVEKHSKGTINRPNTAQAGQIDQRCRLVMMYYGSTRRSRTLRNRYETRPDEILVLQQHCGGENLIVFKDLVYPNQRFAFDSRRHPDYPFALAFYINGMIDSRVSVCCEYRHRNCVRLGSKSGSFAICEIQKVKPCERCSTEKIDKKSFAKRALHSDPDRYRESIVASFNPLNERRSSPLLSPARDDLSKSIFVQSFIREKTPPIVRTPSPPRAVRSESPIRSTEYTTDFRQINDELSSSSSSSSTKISVQKPYESDFDADDDEGKASTSDSMPRKESQDSLPKHIIRQTTADSESDRRSASPVLLNRRRKDSTPRPESPVVNTVEQRPKVEINTKKSMADRKLSKESKDSFFDIESEPKPRKNASDDEDDEDDFFKNLGPPRRPPVNDDLEDIFKTVTNMASQRRYNDSD